MTLKGSSKPDLNILILQLDSKLNPEKNDIISEKRKLVAHVKKDVSDIGTVRNMNYMVVRQLVELLNS